MDDTTLVALIASVILERPTCLICIAAKVGAVKLEVERVLERIGRTVRLETTTRDRCRACGSTLGPVYSLKQPD